MASQEGDAPKVAELLRAGADTGVKVREEGRVRVRAQAAHGHTRLSHFLTVAATPPRLITLTPGQDIDGKTAAELATNQVVLDLLANREKASTF
jgi:hypothetical protein